MIRFLRLAAIVVVSATLAACNTTPPPAPAPVPTEAPTPAPAPEAQAQPVQTPPPEEAQPSFDPTTVTQEQRTATFTDAKALVETLNALIRAKDFESWKTYLTPDYIAYYSDPAVLAKLSESPVLKREGIVLRSLEDYFLQVVYQSRQNARLDDIDFVGKDSIVAITVSPQGDRLVLYHLQRVNDSWKIGMGR